MFIDPRDPEILSVKNIEELSSMRSSMETGAAISCIHIMVSRILVKALSCKDATDQANIGFCNYTRATYPNISEQDYLHETLKFKNVTSTVSKRLSHLYGSLLLQ